MGNKIGENCELEGSVIRNCVIHNNVKIFNSVVENSEICDNAVIGPFAHVRDGCLIGCCCKIGNFVEVKNSNVGTNTKIMHHAYIGDAQIGKFCNISCGVVFCNYDGKNKNKTVIGDYVFIGSNCNLIAPLNVGDGAFIAAGTTVCQDVASGENVIGRIKQKSFKLKNKYLENFEVENDKN